MNVIENLERNSLQDAGAGSLASHLEHLPNLKVLNLGT